VRVSLLFASNAAFDHHFRRIEGIFAVHEAVAARDDCKLVQ